MPPDSEGPKWKFRLKPLPSFPQPLALARTSSYVRNLKPKNNVLLLQAFGSCAMCGSSFEFRGISTPPQSASGACLNAKDLDCILKEKLQ